MFNHKNTAGVVFKMGSFDLYFMIHVSKSTCVGVGTESVTSRFPLMCNQAARFSSIKPAALGTLPTSVLVNYHLITAANHFNSLRPRQNRRHFADDTLKRIILNENVRISIKISLKFVPKGPINNNPALVRIMAWRRSGDKPLSEPTMVSLPTHICVTRPQWVNHVMAILLKPLD